MAGIILPQPTLPGLLLDCKLIIFDEVVQEAAPVPGEAIIRPRPKVLASLLRVCRRINADLARERARLIKPWLQINTFTFDKQRNMRDITRRALYQDLLHLRSVHIDYRIMCPYGFTEHYHPSIYHIRPPSRFLAVTRLSLHTGSIDNVPGLRAREWMATPESIRHERYESHLDRIMCTYPTMPIGLTLEMHCDVLAELFDPSEVTWAPLGMVRVTLSKTCTSPPAGTQKAPDWPYFDSITGWSSTAVQEEVFSF